MSFEMHAERQAYAEVLEHELKQVVRMLRAFPVDRFELRDPECGHSARELALQFVAHANGIEDIASRSVMPHEPITACTRTDIQLKFETAALGAYAALLTPCAGRWDELLEAPASLAPWRHARRGELLWIALRAFVRHDRHFAIHLRAAGHDDGGRRTHRSRVPVDTFAIGA